MKDSVSKTREQISDEQLTDYIKSGKYEYLEILLKRYMPYIKKCVSNRKPFCDEDDLLSAAVYALFLAAKNYNGEKASFGTFANLCIQRAVESTCRRTKKDIPGDMIVSLDDVFLTDNKSPESVLMEKENMNSISKAARGVLSDFEFEVFSAYMSGKTYREIANELCTDAKRVDNALNRIRNKLRK